MSDGRDAGEVDRARDIPRSQVDGHIPSCSAMLCRGRVRSCCWEEEAGKDWKEREESETDWRDQRREGATRNVALR